MRFPTFARQGFESRHNLKYWTRQPYFGFGVDAHSMLISSTPDIEAVRFASPGFPGTVHGRGCFATNLRFAP